MRLALAALVMLTSASGFAVERDADGWIHTGEGIRTKKVAFVNVKVYAIDHAMKELPAEKSKQGVIAAEVDKKIAWKMLRTVEADKIRKALRDGYARNGFSDAAKIDRLLNALNGDLKEGTWVTILYNAKTQKTTLYAPAPRWRAQISCVRPGACGSAASTSRRCPTGCCRSCARTRA